MPKNMRLDGLPKAIHEGDPGAPRTSAATAKAISEGGSGRRYCESDTEEMTQVIEYALLKAGDPQPAAFERACIAVAALRQHFKGGVTHWSKITRNEAAHRLTEQRGDVRQGMQMDSFKKKYNASDRTYYRRKAELTQENS